MVRQDQEANSAPRSGVPAVQAEPRRVQAVAAAQDHSLASTDGGRVFACGDNDAGSC